MKHLNLLPRERRANLRREVPLAAAQRFLTSALVGLLVVSVLAATAGLALRFLPASNNSAAAAEYDRALDDYREINQAIADHDVFITSIAAASSERLTWSPLLRELMAALPPTVTVETLEISREDGEITLAGQADARATLVEVEERLRALPWVEELEAPNSNLLRRFDAEYSFTLTLNNVEN